MRQFHRTAGVLAFALLVSACSLSSMLGGGASKVPPTLLTLAPQAPELPPGVRAAAVGEAVTIEVPIVAESLRTVRVPAQAGPTEVAYIKDLQWVDTPNELFQDLLSETLRRTTSRVVLDPNQSTLDPGLIVSGQLHRMGYDAAQQAVIVRFDAAISTAGGTRVETRRFEARAPADGTAATVGPALNQAANQVAMEFARWIGG